MVQMNVVTVMDPDNTARSKNKPQVHSKAGAAVELGVVMLRRIYEMSVGFKYHASWR